MLDRQCALTATTDIPLMRARRMATTGLTGLSAEYSSAPGHGMGDTTAVAAGGLVAITVVAITAAVAIGVVVAGAMVAQVMVAITDAEAMATLAAPTDAQPTLDAVMPGAATVPAPVASMVAVVGSMVAVAIVKWPGHFSNCDKPTIQVVGFEQARLIKTSADE